MAIPAIAPEEMPDELVDDVLLLLLLLDPVPDPDPDPADPILGFGPPPPPPKATVEAEEAADKPLTWDGVAAA